MGIGLGRALLRKPDNDDGDDDDDGDDEDGGDDDDGDDDGIDEDGDDDIVMMVLKISGV